MAFDGMTVAAVVSELKREIVGGRIYKIAQPEEDEGEKRTGLKALLGKEKKDGGKADE